jgi:hypothetical protein
VKALHVAGVLIAIAGAADASDAMAQAQAAPPLTFLAVWQPEPQTITGESRHLKSEQVLSATRLLPRQLIVNDADVAGADGQVLVPAGTQMLGMVSKVPVACVIQPEKQSAALRILFGRNRFACLIDKDKDGAFDAYFVRGMPDTGFLVGNSKVPAVLTPIKPVAYSERPRGEVQGGPTVELRFNMHHAWVKETSFKVCFTPNTAICLNGWITVKDRNIPGTFEVLGGKVQVFKLEKGQVDAALIEPFADRPLLLFN